MSNSSYYYYKKSINKSKIIHDAIIIYLITVLTVILFNSFLFQAYKVPSNSMYPTLDSNTRIITDKFVVGPRIPLSNRRFFDSIAKNINRGDVVVFMSHEYYKKSVFFRAFSNLIHTLTFTLVDITDMLNQYDSNIYVKRIIGIPGDKIRFELLNDDTIQVKINGVYEKQVIPSEYVLIEENKNNSKLLTAIQLHKEITVGENQYYLLGDNRVSSSDSRVFGTISSNQIIGKAVFTYWPLEKFGVIK